MKKSSAIIFDLDGTLLDTGPGIMESVGFVIDELGLEKQTYEKLKLFVGPPVQDSFKKFYGMNELEAQCAANLFREYYKSKSLLKAEVYLGIFDLLCALRLKGLKIAVATYKRHDYAVIILEKFGIAEYCDSIRGADNENKLKKSDIIQLCMNDLGVLGTECILVGDTEHDAIGAERVGVGFIGVGYGFGFKNRDDVYQFSNRGYAQSVADLHSLLVCEEVFR